MVLRSDVAEKAGVSLAVVSRVLNNSGYVAQDKRERVFQAVKDLQYKPNPVARSLKSNRTNQILFYIRDLSNNYYLDMYKGMAEAATASGYNVIISGNLDIDQISRLMVDGVVFPFEDPATVQQIHRIQVPMVAAGYNLEHSYVTSRINVDLTEAVRLALRHLDSLGHQTIGFAMMEQAQAEQRLEAFRHFRRDKPEDSSPVFGNRGRTDLVGQSDHEVNYFENGILAAQQYLAGNRKATAILCFNDDTATGLMSHLQGEGIRIPQEVSVVGIDNHFSSGYTAPPLTTVSIHPVLHGQECAIALIDLIEGREIRALDQIPCALVVRKSTAAPK